MNDPMFEVSIDKTFNSIDKEWRSTIYLRLYLSMFRSGLAKELGADKLGILLAIASFMDENGECYPSQEKIAETLGMSRQTANRHINKLLEFRWQGKPLIERKKMRDPSISPNEFSVYTILPISHVAIFHSDEGESPAISEDRRTEVQKLIDHFSKRYRETYAVNYSPVWQRDTKHAQRIIKTYPDRWEEIIDTTFFYYDERWKNSKYPRPMLGQLATWLSEQVIEIIDRNNRIESQYGSTSSFDVDTALEELRRKLI